MFIEIVLDVLELVIDVSVLDVHKLFVQDVFKLIFVFENILNR